MEEEKFIGWMDYLIINWQSKGRDCYGAWRENFLSISKKNMGKRVKTNECTITQATRNR